MKLVMYSALAAIAVADITQIAQNLQEVMSNNTMTRSFGSTWATSFIEAIDEFKSRKNPVNKPIRVCIYDYYNKGQDAMSAVQGECISCKIESGVI